METGFPAKRITGAAALTAYVATTYLKPQWSTAAFAAYFVASYVFNFFLFACWTVILYPKVFSPLRGLPEPENLSWYNGQWQKIRDLPTGVPMQQWYGPHCPSSLCCPA